MRRVISILVENKFGVLARISALFAARGFNIDSLSVSKTEDSTVSRIIMIVNCDDYILEQITKQLNKQIDIIKVNDFSNVKYVETELALVKISIDEITRDKIMRLVEIFEAKIINMSHNSIIVEIIGNEDKIDTFIKAAVPYSIKETSRTGVIALGSCLH